MATCFNLVAFVPCYSYLVGAHVLFFFYPYVRVFSPSVGSSLPSGIKLLMFNGVMLSHNTSFPISRDL